MTTSIARAPTASSKSATSSSPTGDAVSARSASTGRAAYLRSTGCAAERDTHERPVQERHGRPDQPRDWTVVRDPGRPLQPSVDAPEDVGCAQEPRCEVTHGLVWASVRDAPTEDVVRRRPRPEPEAEHQPPSREHEPAQRSRCTLPSLTRPLFRGTLVIRCDVD